MTIIIMLVMGVINAVVMYAAFTKLANMFDPSKKKAKRRHQQRMKRIFQN